MKRIALFIPGFGGGGAENVFIILANYWTRSGVDVDYLVCKSDGPMRSRLDDRVNVIVLGTNGGRLFRRIVLANKIATHCREHRPDILISTLTYCNLTVLLARRLFGCQSTPLVIREANSIENIKKGGKLSAWISFRAMKWLYPFADKITANSENTLQELETQLGLSSSQLQLIRNPVVMPSLTGRSGSDNEITILGCGRLIPQKDFATLIRAVAIVRKKRRCRLVIIGDGSERDHLLTLAYELGFSSEEFQLPGFVDNVEDFYQAADLFVLSSMWEGLPNVVLEALSYGLPVVATDCSGGTREIFECNEARFLVGVGAVEELAARINCMLDESNLKDEMLTLV
ncbi:MAG: glycosyltransferase, partial [Opitutae bacterium]|nr:glycosyltransferase [Opitutae bacterium]